MRDLSNPPRFELSQPQQLVNCGRIQHTAQRKGENSSTGWINFAQLATISFGVLSDASGTDSLRFEDNSSYLPVHRGWLVLIGVLHRYAHRRDFGLPAGSPEGPDIQLLGTKDCLSGLSGIMAVDGLSYEHGSHILRFRMHDNVQLNHNLARELVPLSHLCYLFIDLLPGSGGILLNVQKARPDYRSRVRDQREDKWESENLEANVAILELRKSDIPIYTNKALAHSLGLRTANMCKILEPRRSDTTTAAELTRRISTKL